MSCIYEGDILFFLLLEEEIRANLCISFNSEQTWGEFESSKAWKNLRLVDGKK